MRSRTALRQLAWYKVGGPQAHALIGWVVCVASVDWIGWVVVSLALREPIFCWISARIDMNKLLIINAIRIQDSCNPYVCNVM